MSCDGNRHKFFQVVSSSDLPEEVLERVYQANRHTPNSPGEKLAAEAKTRALFAMMEAKGIKPPTHAADGLPRKASQSGYAAVFDVLQNREHAGEEEEEDEEYRCLRLSGYDDTGYDKHGYDREGFDKQGYDKEGYNSYGFDEEGYNRHGYNRKGYDQDGYNVYGLNASGWDREGYDAEGYNSAGYDRGGYNKKGFDNEGYDRGGYDKDGYDRRGNRHSFFTPDQDGMLGDGRDKHGFDEEGYSDRGYDRNGYNKQGRDDRGYDINGRDEWGYARNGSYYRTDEDGYSPRGYKEHPDGIYRDRLGFDRDGFDEDGYTSTGYDKNGRDKDGNRRDRRFTRGKSGKRLKANFCKSGWDQDGYDRWGFHKETGLTAPDETGLKRNWLGWIYDPDELVCYNPEDPEQKMKWGRKSYGNSVVYDRFEYANHKHHRAAQLEDGTYAGRVLPDSSLDPKEAGRAYQPPPKRDPHDIMSFEEFAKAHSRRGYTTEQMRRMYNRNLTNYLSTEEEVAESLRRRWAISEARSDAGGHKEVHNGFRTRCPYCGQYTGGKPHHCPSHSQYGHDVYVPSSGRLFANYGDLLYDPSISPEENNFPDGYNSSGVDKEGYDRQGYDRKGFSRQGYDRQGYDRLGYDQDGYDRDGYNRKGLDREGNKRPATLESVAPMLSTEEDLLSNDDLADLYSRIATGLVGEPRSVRLEEGGGFGTDMRGTIKADPYPLGRNADPRANLVVTRAGIHHELGHELFTDAAVWAQVLEVAQGKQKIEGLEDAAGLLPHMFNIVEDGRMERKLSRRYAGVSEVLNASCRLEPRWDEEMGSDVPVSNQLLGASLYRALPFFAVSSKKIEEEMPKKLRAVYDDFVPAIDRAVNGSAEDAFEAAVFMARRIEEAGLTAPPPPRDAVNLKPPPAPPEGTDARRTRPSGSGEDEATGQGRRSRAEDLDQVRTKPRVKGEANRELARMRTQVKGEADLDQVRTKPWAKGAVIRELARMRTQVKGEADLDQVRTKPRAKGEVIRELARMRTQVKGEAGLDQVRTKPRAKGAVIRELTRMRTQVKEAADRELATPEEEVERNQKKTTGLPPWTRIPCRMCSQTSAGRAARP